MKWSRSACASAEPSVGSVPAPSSSSRTSVPGPAASTIRGIGLGGPGKAERLWEVAGEGGEALGDRLLVPDVREDIAEDRQARASLRRHVQPGLMHQREQTQ